MEKQGQVVRQIRRNSRSLVRQLGFLRSGAEVAGVPFAWCHCLMELEFHGLLQASDLASLLNVDKSAISRTVRAMEKEGLVAIKPDASDGRKRPLTLTAKGQQTAAKIHEICDAQVQDALGFLSPDEQTIVQSGLELYARALRRASQRGDFKIRQIVPEDNPEVASIIRKVMPEFGANGDGFAIHDPEVEDMFASYDNECAHFYVVEKGGKLIGCGGLAQLEGGPQDTCELRKMYFLTEARGLGIGRILLSQCLSRAKELGYLKCYLETLTHMSQARALYEKMGFKKLGEPMGDTGHHGCNSWYLRCL